MGRPKLQVIGQSFGRLTVVGQAPSDNRQMSRVYCRCSCGNPRTVIVVSADIVRGRTRSCGCLAAAAGASISQAAYKERYHNTAKAAEFLVAADLSQAGFVVHMSSSGAPHDMIAEAADGHLFKIQVKGTKQKAKKYGSGRTPPPYKWALAARRSGKYSAQEVDIIALVALDILTVAYMPLLKSSQVVVTLHPPGAGEDKELRRMDSYTLLTAILQARAAHLNKETVRGRKRR